MSREIHNDNKQYLTCNMLRAQSHVKIICFNISQILLIAFTESFYVVWYLRGWGVECVESHPEQTTLVCGVTRSYNNVLHSSGQQSPKKAYNTISTLLPPPKVRFCQCGIFGMRHQVAKKILKSISKEWFIVTIFSTSSNSPSVRLCCDTSYFC